MDYWFQILVHSNYSTLSIQVWESTQSYHECLFYYARMCNVRFHRSRNQLYEKYVKIRRSLAIRYLIIVISKDFLFNYIFYSLELIHSSPFDVVHFVCIYKGIFIVEHIEHLQKREEYRLRYWKNPFLCCSCVYPLAAQRVSPIQESQHLQTLGVCASPEIVT